MRNFFVAFAIGILFLATSLSANAQAINSAVCSSQLVTPPPPNQPYYQIKGAASANNLPAGTTSVSFTFNFQYKSHGMWLGSFSTQITTNQVGGSASGDTGWLGFSPTSGQEWRVLVGGSYTVNGTLTNFTSVG